MSSHRSIAAIASLTVALVLSLSTAHAAVFELTGGDPTEGYDPLPVTKYAYHFTQTGFSQATDVIQNVPFLPFNYVTYTTTVGSVNVYGAGAYYVEGPSLGPSANDAALRDANALYFFSNFPDVHSETLTLSDLIPGRTYQLDLFNQNRERDIPATFTVTDGTGTLTPLSVAGVVGVYYDVRFSVVADGAGVVSVLVSNLPTDPTNPALNAFSLTTLPEPTSVALLAVAPLLLTGRRR